MSISNSDKKMVRKLCEISERLLGENPDPRTLSAADRDELRNAAKLLFPLLQRIADDTE